MDRPSASSNGRPTTATVDQTDIRGSGPHDWEPSGAASVLGRGSAAGAGAAKSDRGFSVWLGASAARGRRALLCSGAPERLVGCDRPHEPGELAGAGDNHLLVRLAATGHPPPAGVQALLAAPGALDDDSTLTALAAGELVADLWPAARMPGGFDQKAAHMSVADFGDRSLPAALPGGVLGRNEADEA